MATTYTLKFEVREEPDDVFANFTQIRIYRSLTGLLADRVLLDAVALVADQYQYEYVDAAGVDAAKAWFTYYHDVTLAETDYSDPITYGTSDQWYMSLDELRAEGITVGMADDARLTRLIYLTQSFIDRVTGHHFLPVSKTIKIDSIESPTLELPEPIIRIDTLELEELTGAVPLTSAYDHTTMRIYNRHLTQALLSPDDRTRPRIEIVPELFQIFQWPAIFVEAKQSMKITGVFGYTELRPEDEVGETTAGSQIPICYGSTPPMIKELMARLVMRWISPVGQAEYRRMDEMIGQVESWKTSKQWIRYFDKAETKPTITGDVGIDSIIWLYSRRTSLRLAVAC